MAKLGRPKGSKNKPKWLKELIAQQPKRPRGRPKGAKKRPTTLVDFVAASLSDTNEPPAVPPKPKGRCNHDGSAKLNSIPREQMIERNRKAAKARWEKHYAAQEEPGPPIHKGWTPEQAALAYEQAKREARRIFNIMADEGRVPDSPEAQEAMLAVLTLMRGKGTKDFKLKAARTVLEYTKAKPAAKHDHTIRTAEDFLDDLAAEEGTNEES